MAGRVRFSIFSALLLAGCTSSLPKPPPTPDQQLRALVGQLESDPNTSVAAKRVADGAISRIKSQKEIDDFSAEN